MTTNTPQTARTGGRVLVDQLRIHGTERIFCVPGESFLDVLDALHDQPAIDLVVCKHEGAAANMAEADGKLTGRPGICFVTRGPGATHGSIGVHIAQQDSTPMILFVGQIAREHKGREAFQEVDYAAVFGSMCKWAAEIDDPARIPEMVARAFAVATSGRPGPVVLALPEDVLDGLVDVADAAPYRSVAAAPRPEDAKALAAALATAQRPLVIAGGANWTDQTVRDFAAFVKAWDLPVACAFRRQDVIDNRDPHYVGHLSLGVSPKLAERVKTADLIVAFGTRLGDIATDSYSLLEVPQPTQKLVHIHADSFELGRVYQAALPIHAGVEPGAAMLASLAAPASVPWKDWTAGARAEHEAFVTPPKPHAELTGVDMAAAMAHLNQVLPEDAMLSNGAGNYTVWLHRFYAYKRPRTELAPTCGAMGYGLPAAIAAKLRYPEKTVVCFAGDGCYLMYPQEIATAAAHGVNLIVILVNNRMYGTIRMHQERRYPGRQSGTTIVNPDFVEMAKACGAWAERVERTEDFAAAFARAQQAGKPAVLELVTDPLQITPAMRVSELPK
ncbi:MULTISPECIES: thiamine pyrophosphate-binding protein [unclassified Cupriavidus]|uniref:thiamine pyrophosphate-binding protein n=1 Tax=unclassified Cupriavidus TaxID=2640874 RepID=UPI001C003364|nr:MULTISPECIES: thiamine pyrophosphate-binding protein [unclassified Cupriavidus]MCA3184372.1 thiamine pyrophosphate-binding protein [Cupriavidus sp.]MCA3189614.1 thiamine pyrophosphate-binding protein [Cupriavidus sp.]MCA3195748.1 thiamine pyrophosphate-binding protein [Cupriavidus sp.]MCA3203906.1 thiamine pyrophosphate-binding protein [Cupriavidus sp.]MCA3206134.1 thiamine pyrophosphate-binding protein [Cupriavidus sp.]